MLIFQQTLPQRLVFVCGLYIPTLAVCGVVVAAITLTLEPRATPLHYFVHVLYLVSIERKMLSAFVPFLFNVFGDQFLIYFLVFWSV